MTCSFTDINHGYVTCELLMVVSSQSTRVVSVCMGVCVPFVLNFCFVFRVRRVSRYVEKTESTVRGDHPLINVMHPHVPTEL